MKVSTRAFVVKMGHFIEFRAARDAPKAKVSRVVRKITVKRDVYDWNTGCYRSRTRVEPFTLEQTFYVGGRVVGVVNDKTYLTEFKGFPRITRNTGIKELKGAQALSILDPQWRKSHHL